MTRDEVVAWVASYLAPCINEELPQIQGIYTFGPHTCGEGKVLLSEPVIVDQGRMVATISVDDIADEIYMKAPQSLDAHTFAIYCSESVQLAEWHKWNVERGAFSL